MIFQNELGSIYHAQDLEEDAEPRDMVHASEVTIPATDTQFGQFSCDSIDLSVPLYYGDSDLALNEGAGMYPASYMPGFGGTILVAGHNMTYFRSFENLELGDIFTIQTNYGVYEYQVSEIGVWRYDDPDVVDFGQTEGELLVAYTCYPFGSVVGLTDERLFVYAWKISGPEVIWDAE